MVTAAAAAAALGLCLYFCDGEMLVLGVTVCISDSIKMKLKQFGASAFICKLLVLLHGENLANRFLSGLFQEPYIYMICSCSEDSILSFRNCNLSIIGRVSRQQLNQ